MADEHKTAEDEKQEALHAERLADKAESADAEAPVGATGGTEPTKSATPKR